MPHFALTAIGEDQPGIVSAVTEPLARLGCNLEDSSSCILRGHFAVMLILAAPAGLEAAGIAAEISRYTDPLGVIVTVRPLREEAVTASAAPSHLLSVYGADRPGIVHGVTQLLFDRGINITELNTRLVGRAQAPVYAMLMELALPAGTGSAELEADLRELAGRLAVDVSLRPLDAEAL
ncbi:MAG: ACT domain-containing protein [Candidatus Sericytochromatia bacterium]|nr:ACT domain-containing protein [Candidatus Tanganyikabacteria bacterium]